MAEQSLLDNYLSKKIPDYKPGSVNPATAAFAAALDSVGAVLPDLVDTIKQELTAWRQSCCSRKANEKGSSKEATGHPGSRITAT